jgi:uncharacterized membrane protein YeaQ/YmgE (transglycosylase-associated protein family)
MRLTGLLFTAVGILAAMLLVYVFGGAAVGRGLLWALSGAFVGWLGSIVSRSDTQQLILTYLLVGASGAVAGLLLYGGGSLTEGGPVERLFSAILGSVTLLIAIALGRRWLPSATRQHETAGAPQPHGPPAASEFPIERPH